MHIHTRNILNLLRYYLQDPKHGKNKPEHILFMNKNALPLSVLKDLLKFQYRILHTRYSKGVILGRGNYRGLKLTHQIRKIVERVIVKLKRQQVDTN